jgi:hypothetical protein
MFEISIGVEVYGHAEMMPLGGIARYFTPSG